MNRPLKLIAKILITVAFVPVLAALIVASCTAVRAQERYIIRDPQSPHETLILRQESEGRYILSNPMNPTYRQIIRTRPDGSAVITNPYRPHERTIIRRQSHD